MVNFPSIFIALNENGEPLVRDGQYENTETGEKRAVGSFGSDAGDIRFKRGKASAASVAQSLGQANQPMTQAEIASMLEKIGPLSTRCMRP